MERYKGRRSNLEFHHGSLENPEPSEVVLYEAGTNKPSLQFDRRTRSVVVNGIKKDLALTEYRLLRTLVDGQGRVINREDLCLLGHSNLEMSSGSLRVWIHRLDRKLQNPEGFKFIENLKGVGYRFNATPSETKRTEEVEYRLGGGRVFYPESNRIEIEGERNYFTKTENGLLWLLAENLNEVVSKEELIDEAWDRDNDKHGDTGSLLREYIKRLRSKLKDEKKEGENNFTVLQTVHGVGYKLRP